MWMILIVILLLFLINQSEGYGYPGLDYAPFSSHIYPVWSQWSRRITDSPHYRKWMRYPYHRYLTYGYFA